MKKVRLSSIAAVNAGGTPSRSNLSYWNGDIPWVKISDIQGKHVQTYEEAITDEGLKNSSAKLFYKGTILYTIFATLGRVGILDFDATTNQAIAGINILDETIDCDYLYYFLRSQEKKVKAIGKGAAQQNINLKILRDWLVPIRSKEEQTNIVGSLEKIESAISAKTELLNSLDFLVKSRFMEMFPNWDLSLQMPDWVQLGTLTKIYTGTTPKTDQKDFWGGDIPWVTPAELDSDSYIVSDTERHITEAGRASKSLSLMPVGTVLLSTRAPIGKVAICGTPMTCNQGFKNFECGNKLNPTFLYVLLKLNVEWLQSQGTGATFKEISKTKAGSIRIHVPSIESQTKFESFYKLIDKSRFIVQSQIKDLQELLDSKMDEYFGGDEG